MKFVTDSEKHKCQYLQLSRPWAKKYSDAAHAARVKVIHFHCEKPEELKDMFDRGRDFVMTNHLEPMNRKLMKLGISMWD